MSYTFRWILYLINKLLTVASLAWIIYSLIGLVSNLESWLTWLMYIGIGIVAYILSKFIYVIRKSYFPLAGKDYL